MHCLGGVTWRVEAAERLSVYFSQKPAFIIFDNELLAV
jgi:hypothetical protein